MTLVIGQNDDRRVLSLAASKSLVSFAKSRHLGMLSFWETTRDRNACTGTLCMCTNVTQKPYDFSKIIAGYAG